MAAKKVTKPPIARNKLDTIGIDALCAVDIYVLRCPKSGEVRYVGKANNAQARLKSHLRDCKRRNTPVYCWMRSLLADGMIPAIEIVQQVVLGDWAKSEINLIAKLRADGVRLLNLADGGDQPSQTKEQRQSAGRAAVKARTKTPEAKRLYQLKHHMGVLLRAGVSETVKAKLRYAAMKRPDLFGQWATL